jgi:hypothetical protein
MGTIYLAKANDQAVSFCRCERPLIGSPAQMDCPWCGCGWLFVCSECGKAFTFAVGVELDESLEDIGRRVLRREHRREPDGKEVTGWASAMESMLQDVEPGETYVFLDGNYIPAASGRVAFEGWFAHHDLPQLPQVQAATDPTVLEATLASQEYWTQRSITGPES